MKGLLGLPKAIPPWFAKGNLRLARRVNIFWAIFGEITNTYITTCGAPNLRIN